MRDGYLSAPRMSGVGSFYPDRPFNSAYRGAEHQGPEKTLVVSGRAAAPGAKGIKPDAQLTKDGEVVVVHQLPQPGGKEDPGRASWTRDSIVLRLLPDTGFRRCRRLSRCGGDCLLLNVELKTGGLRDDGFPAAVVRGIEEISLFERAILSSFRPVVLRQSRQLNPGIPTGVPYTSRRLLFLSGGGFAPGCGLNA